MHSSLTILAILLFFSWGCNVTKHLGPGERLVTSNEIELEKEWPEQDKRKLENKLDDLARPRPNDRLFGFIPFKVRMYQYAEDTTTKLKKWIMKRMAERPALYDSTRSEQSATKMEKYLFNKGYFYSGVQFDVIQKNPDKPKVQVKYKVQPRQLSYFGDISYEIQDTTISKLVKKDTSLLERANRSPFDMEALVDERSRINRLMAQNGYYRFSKQYVMFDLDTVAADNKIDVYVRVLPPENQTKHHQYHINDVYIIPDYDEALHEVKNYDTLNYKGYDILHRGLNYHPQSLLNGVFLHEGELYDKSNYQLTINRLTNLSVFRFVNVELKPVADSTQHRLDVMIKLMPAKQREINVNLNATSSSYYFLGSEAGVNYTNKNLFNYTDVFSLGLNGGIETRSDSGRGLYLNTVEFNGNADFYFPTLLNPFGFKIDQERYNPQTILSARYNYFRRVKYYTLNSTSFSYNVEWTQNPRIRHAVTPIDINFVRVTDTTEAFSETVQRNPILRQSFQDQLIVGSRYSFIYSNQNTGRPNFWYFRGNIDAAGNLLNAGYSLAKGGRENGEAYRLFGRPFSQYIRPDVELKYYYSLSNEQKLVGRILAGVGIPLGNSNVLPYIKQFVIGGSNSVRAFRVRELGPGQTGDQTNTGFNDRTGDMKLEANVEYRFPIYDIFKGALFVDAGNIWLLEDDEHPERVFYFDRFYKDLGIGTGFGVRVDFSFFVMRFDLGIPVRVPYQSKNNGWRIKSFVNEFSPLNGDWLRDHLRLNLAIGYPF